MPELEYAMSCVLLLMQCAKLLASMLWMTPPSCGPKGTLHNTGCASHVHILRHQGALLAYVQGKLTEAWSLYEQCVVIMDKCLGPDHPDVAALYNNQASTLAQQVRPVE